MHKEPQASVTFTFNEVEALLLSVEPRHLQDLGPYFDKAKAKLMKLRNELKKEAEEQVKLF
jgi:hypothetical protein